MGIHFHIAAPEAWFLVPACVVDHLEQASELELKVLMLLLHSGRKASDQLICSRLSIMEGQLQQAVAAWISRGVLCMEDRWVALAQPQLSLAKQTDSRQPSPLIRRPDYDMMQVQQALSENEELRRALQEAPALLGRDLGQTEFGLLYSLHDYYGFPPASIRLLLRHLGDTRRTSGSAIEKLAADWQSRDILSPDEIEKAIADDCRRRSSETMVRRAFGLGDRKLSPTERQHIERWTLVWHVDEQLLELAYNRSVDRVSKVSFSYINKILSDWQVKGIKTVEQAEQEVLPPRRASNKKAADTSFAPTYNLKEFEAWSFQTLYGEGGSTEQEGGGSG